MSAETVLWAGAAFNFALGIFHLAFWRLFRWREELPKLNAVNRGVMQVLNLMLTYVFFAVATLQFLHPAACLTTPVGRTATAVVAGFWFLRALLQPLFWPRTRLGWAMTALFSVGAALHAVALIFR